MDNDVLQISGATPSSAHHRPVFLEEREWAIFIDELKLSRREAEISNLILEGRSERTIADVLAISTHTVHSHLERLYRKVHVRTRCELVGLFFRTYVRLHRTECHQKDHRASDTAGN